jgi:hypothetical protein
VDRYTNNAYLVGNFSIAAARLYRELGEDDKAAQSYAKNATSSNAWMKGLSRFEQACFLIGKGRNEEARQLLSEPLAGRNSGQIQIALFSLLGYSYYRSGDDAKALEFSQAAINRHKKMGALLAGEGLESQIDMALKTIKYVASWRDSPLQAEPPAVRIVLSPTERSRALVRAVVRLKSRGCAPLHLESNNESVQVTASSPERAVDGGYYYETKLAIEVEPAAVRTTVEAVVTVRCEQDPKMAVAIPIHVLTQ